MSWYDSHDYNRRPRRRGITVLGVLALVVTALIAGAVLMLAVGGGLLYAAQQSPSYAHSPAPTAVRETPPISITPHPEATPPPLGGSHAWLFTSEDQVADIVEQVSETVVGVTNYATFNYSGKRVEEAQASGSGVILSADGYIITNHHVISDASRIVVTLSNGEDYDAKLVGSDDRADVAVLKIEASGLTSALIGDSETVRAGQVAIAIGNPLGQEYAGTVTVGVISSPKRSVEVDNVTGRMMQMLQTDAAINPGNSGGALVNIRGELVGINTMKTVFAGRDEYGNVIAAEGIGFAIPVHIAMPLVNELISNGYVSRPWIGIGNMSVIDEATAARLNLPEGVWVNKVYPDTPAERAGIKPEDVVTELNGVRILTFADLTQEIDRHKVGDTITIKVYRASGNSGETLELSVTLTEYHTYDTGLLATPEPTQEADEAWQWWPWGD